MSRVHDIVRDGDTESLIRKYLKAGVMTPQEYEETRPGIPQGGNLSLLLSNIMLNELDKELEVSCLDYYKERHKFSTPKDRKPLILLENL